MTAGQAPARGSMQDSLPQSLRHRHDAADPRDRCQLTKPLPAKPIISIIHDTIEKLCSARFAFSRSGAPCLFDRLGRGRYRIHVRGSSGFA
jgi:hypothetical protein